MARTLNITTLSERMYPSKGGWAVRAAPGGIRGTFWGRTKTDCKENVLAEIDRLEKLRHGRSTIDPPPKNYDELCTKRLAVYRQRESSKATFASQLNASRKVFGPLQLEQITRHRVEEWAVDLSEGGLAPVTIANYLDDMERVLEYARDNAWLTGPNPVKNVDRPALEFQPDPFENWETVFEIARAFETIDFAVGGLITRFAAGLGLRPQEVLVARECDIDRLAQTFGVFRTWDDTRRTEVELTKTTASCATLNLTTIAAEVINELPQAIHRDPTKWHLSPLLFSRADGSRITPDYFRNKWVDALATLHDVPYKPPKRLRDTFGTLTLLELGLDQIKTVSTLMRHTSEKVTLQHYAKIVQDLRLKAAGDASGGMPAFTSFRSK